jgi:hypothetical protein
MSRGRRRRGGGGGRLGGGHGQGGDGCRQRECSNAAVAWQRRQQQRDRAMVDGNEMAVPGHAR